MAKAILINDDGEVAELVLGKDTWVLASIQDGGEITYTRIGTTGEYSMDRHAIHLPVGV